MALAAEKSAAASNAPNTMPGEVARGLISLWIVFHLLAIGLAIGTNSGLGQSQLLGRVKSAPILDQYLHALWLDVGYNYHFYYNTFSDSDYSLQIELKFADGKTETLEYPPKDAAAGERLERYMRLASTAASAIDMDNEGAIPGAMGEQLLRAHDAKELTFRIVRHAPITIDSAKDNDAAVRDPFVPSTYTTDYTATVTLDSRGRPQVRKAAESRTDVAPVTGGSGASNTNTPTTGTAAPTTGGTRARPGVSPPPAKPVPSDRPSLVPRNPFPSKDAAPALPEGGAK